MSARRVLAIVETRRTDRAVVERAVEVVAESGGYLTLVAVAQPPFHCFNPGPFFSPMVSREELREEASKALATATASLPAWVPLLSGIDEGAVRTVVRRRISLAAHDLVILGSRPFACRAFTSPFVLA